MKTSITRAGTTALIVGVALMFTACASSEEPETIMDVPAGSPTSAEVLGQGTVIQKGEGAVEFCLGPITMIYPPDCGGPEIVGWDWDAVEGDETEGTTTWGTYAVQGTWDGDRLTVTQPPIMLALYDPMAVEDPYVDPENAGTSSEAELLAIQSELAETEPGILGSFAQNGYLFVEVIHDDGTLQSRLDTTYGQEVVVVRSQLVAVE